MTTPEEPKFEIKLPPEMTVAQATELAVKFLQDGNFEPAEMLLRRVVETAPDHADALHFLGMILCDLGQGSEGAPMVERSLELVPNLPDWHNNFGIVCVRRDQLPAAKAAFEKALALSDDSLITAQFNLGVTLRLMGELDAAQAQYEKTIALRPDYAEARYSYAGLLAARGDNAASLKQLELAREQTNAENVRTLEALGIGYRRVRQYDKAIEVYRKWCEIDPENAVPEHYLKAMLAGDDAPDRASDAYVAATFDGFAQSFDHVLANLGYKAPPLIRDALKATRPDADGSLHILDAGAGTGLCGPLVRPWAAKLTGVDLSSKMLIRAKDRDCYDRLETAELTAFMTSEPGAYDIIISADTLCYFGALEEALAAAHGALRPGGHLFFSVERDEEGAKSAGFVLQPHGRYAHAEHYVRGCLTQAGFAVEDVSQAVLRTEGPDEVHGMIVTAVRA